MTIKALETRYAGCRFRSRLEARWAVFLNELGIAWEYEPQGFEVTRRISNPWNEDDTFRYLPDFWLPDLGIWFEVKGELNPSEALRLLDAAAALSSNNGGGCHDSGGHDLAVAGPLTSSGAVGLPILLHMHKGDLEASCLWCGAHSPYVSLADDMDGEAPNVGPVLLRGWYCAKHSSNPLILAAIDKARTARFEFGARR